MARFFSLTLLVVGLAAFATAQNPPSSSSSSPEPESGFLSPTRYTNAYFGFSLPVPQNADLRSFFLSSNASSHFLYGIRSNGSGQSVMSVFAQPTRKDPNSEAKDAVRGAKKSSVKKVMIGGKEFWRGEFTSESPAGKVESLTYAIPMRGYVISFSIFAFDSSLARAFQNSVESVRFFDPGQARQVAGPDSKPFNPAHPDDSSSAPVPHSERMAQLSPGEVSSGFYNNDDLGIAYVLPSGWVANGASTAKSASDAAAETVDSDEQQAARERQVAEECARRLLLASPPAESANTPGLQPMVALFAGDPTCWPEAHLPASANDQDAMQRVATAFLGALATAPSKDARFSTRKEPVSGHLLYDMDWLLNATSSNGRPVRTYWSIVMAENNGYWLAWEFLSPTEQGLQQLKKTEIAFARPLADAGH